MNCDCIQEMEKDVAEKFAAEAGNNVQALCKSIGFAVVGNTLTAHLFIPFSVTGTKRGFNSKNGRAVNMLARFCPFCGKDQAPKGTQE